MLEARNISLTLNDTAVLQSVSCHFRPAAISLLTGPNGSGKTMLFQVLAGLQQADEGEVLLNGSAYPQKGQPLGTGVGIVFQQPEMQIIEQTVEEDILFGLRNINLEAGEMEARLEESLRWSELFERRHQYPHTLSGGELRRLTLAGVFAMGAQYILLDEPFENLDYSGVRETLHQILKLRESGHGVVLITHDLDKCLAHVDHLIVLKDGSIMADGLPEELLPHLEEHGVRPPPLDIRNMTWC